MAAAKPAASSIVRLPPPEITPEMIPRLLPYDVGHEERPVLTQGSVDVRRAQLVGSGANGELGAPRVLTVDSTEASADVDGTRRRLIRMN
jgi:hypothetical protein